MEILNTEENGKQELELKCPFFGVPCVSFCPAWIHGMEDCLFHVCLTDVRETFFDAARYLDEQTGLLEGTGAVLMQASRDGMIIPEDVIPVVTHCMNGLLTAGVMGKLTGYAPTRLGNWLSGVEEVMRFDFKTLFDVLDEDEAAPE